MRGTRSPMALPQGANQRWSLDFVADTLDSGRRFRVLVVIDDFSRECLALLVDISALGQAGYAQADCDHVGRQAQGHAQAETEAGIISLMRRLARSLWSVFHLTAATPAHSEIRARVASKSHNLTAL